MSQKWKKIGEETVFKKYGRSIVKKDFQMPNGTVSDFYIMETNNPVCIFALTERNEVILAKQFRPGPEEVLLELPGGGINTDEVPETAAARELLEETGFTGEMKLVARCLDSAYTTIDRYCFIATNCKKTSEQKLDPNEFVEVVTMPLKEFRKYLQSGRLTDAEVAYLSLDYLGLL